MKYLVEATASIERADAIDEKGGPAPLFSYIVQRFKPEVFYGNPTRRQVFLIVDLATETDVAELMFVIVRNVGAEPKFTPIMPVENFGKAIEKANKGPRL
jgi:hypothetical protein